PRAGAAFAPTSQTSTTDRWSAATPGPPSSVGPEIVRLRAAAVPDDVVVAVAVVVARQGGVVGPAHGQVGGVEGATGPAVPDAVGAGAGAVPDDVVLAVVVVVAHDRPGVARLVDPLAGEAAVAVAEPEVVQGGAGAVPEDVG